MLNLYQLLWYYCKRSASLISRYDRARKRVVLRNKFPATALRYRTSRFTLVEQCGSFNGIEYFHSSTKSTKLVHLNLTPRQIVRAGVGVICAHLMAVCREIKVKPEEKGTEKASKLVDGNFLVENSELCTRAIFRPFIDPGAQN